MAQVSYIKRDINKLEPSGTATKFDMGSLLVLAMFSYAVLPAAAQNLLNVRAPVWANVQTETSPLASMLGTLFQFAVLGSVAILAVAGLRRLRIGPWLVIFLLPWAAMNIATVYMEGRFSYSSVVFPLVGLAAGGLAEPMRTLRTVGILTGVLAAGSIAMGALLPKAGLFSVSLLNDKSIIGDKLLVGPLYHPNSLGETLALGLPFVLLIKSKFWRGVSFALVVFALVWTASRTGIIAASVGCIVAICWMAVRNSQKSMLAPLILACIYMTVIFVGPAAVSYGIADPKSFSGRGQIWQGSLEQWERSPLIGNGVHIYAELAKMWNNVGIGAFHGHNMYVTFLMTAGVLGAAALTIVYIAILTRSWKLGSAGIIGPAVWPIAFIADGWMEVPSDLFTLGTISWVVWVPLAVVLSGILHQTTTSTEAHPGTVEGKH